MADLDRIQKLVEEIHAGLFGKERLGENAGDDGAPDPVQPVVGFDKVFGPKPHPSDATAGTIWRREATRVTKVYEDIPSEYEAGAMELAAQTGVKAVFLEYQGQTKASVKPGLSPWLVDASNFVGSNVEGLIRSVLDNK